MKASLLLSLAMVFSLSAASLNDKIVYMDNLKELVILTQKVRGNMNIYLKGGDVLYSEISDYRDSVDTSLRDLHYKFQTVDTETDDELSKLNIYMQSLHDVSYELNPMTTFRAYTLLINEMIVIGNDVQEDFFTDDEIRHKRVSAVMMQNILSLTENIGRLRGLGSGVAVYGECEDEECMELKNYIVDVSDGLDELILEMKSLSWTYKDMYPKSLNSELNRYQKEVKKYLSLIEAKIIDKEENVNIDVYDFFSNGTSLIDQTLKYYTMNEMLLKN